MRSEMIAALILVCTASSGCGGQIIYLGTINGNQVHLIKHNDLLTASRMIVVTDHDGRVVSNVGGTVQGGGSVLAGVVTGVVTAGAVAYGAHEISSALQGAAVTVKGGVTGSLKGQVQGNVSVTDSAGKTSTLSGSGKIGP